MKTSIDNYQDVIDSRDVIARIRELKEEREALEQDLQEWEAENAEGLRTGEDLEEQRQARVGALQEWDDENEEELKTLEAFGEEGESNCSDWQYGATCIRESYFVEYVQELLVDLGYLPKDLPYWIAIDWETTAKNVKEDYSEIDFDGVTYLVR